MTAITTMTDLERARQHWPAEPLSIDEICDNADAECELDDDPWHEVPLTDEWADEVWGWIKDIYPGPRPGTDLLCDIDGAARFYAEARDIDRTGPTPVEVLNLYFHLDIPCPNPGCPAGIGIPCGHMIREDRFHEIAVRIMAEGPQEHRSNFPE